MTPSTFHALSRQLLSTPVDTPEELGVICDSIMTFGMIDALHSSSSIATCARFCASAAAHFSREHLGGKPAFQVQATPGPGGEVRHARLCRGACAAVRSPAPPPVTRAGWLVTPCAAAPQAAPFLDFACVLQQRCADKCAQLQQGKPHQFPTGFCGLMAELHKQGVIGPARTHMLPLALEHAQHAPP